MELPDRAAAWFRELQERISAALTAADGAAQFREDVWTREGGGGGRSRVLEAGDVFEKAGVNWSDVTGDLPDELAEKMPGSGRAFRATGVSVVIHPRSPMIPTSHANFRCLVKGDVAWFGGGADLTPYYPYRDDVILFHRAWQDVCDRHDATYYPRFKKWCDEYFYLPHRGETRGVGGIFFDYLRRDDIEETFAFVRDAGDTFLPAYLPIVERRRGEPWGEPEREFQLWRRGRYVEFNLIYDRGTIFGLKTNGRAESILMSLPPVVRWRYDHRPEPGSREAELVSYLTPQDWLAAP
ncbi:MAG TPA: oxygen-dependent coproporphyrinogen oxidase [Haliangiales bacterium]|nr:oxygen-dependent coproporphyrinogen oxidase [Haliangiales bacterium]